MKTIIAIAGLTLLTLCSPVCAQQADPCSGLWGFALGQCRANQQRLQQQQQAQQQQQLEQQSWQQRQDQQTLHEQQEQQKQIQNQQLENLKLQNEILRKQLEQEKSSATGAGPDYSSMPEFKSWREANSWFGRDRAKTEFAVLYAKQLRQDRPDLVGRPFFDAVSDKVREVFAAR